MPKLLNCQPIPSEPPTNLSAPLYCTSAAATAGFRRDAGTFFDSLQRLEFPGSVFFLGRLEFQGSGFVGHDSLGIRIQSFVLPFRVRD